MRQPSRRFPGRGGKRSGSGRHRIEANEVSVVVGIRFPRAFLEEVKEVARANRNTLSQGVRALIQKELLPRFPKGEIPG